MSKEIPRVNTKLVLAMYIINFILFFLIKWGKTLQESKKLRESELSNNNSDKNTMKKIRAINKK
jgi:large-conductance mechanosensitive channel